MNFNASPRLLSNPSNTLIGTVGAAGLMFASHTAEAAAPIPEFNPNQHVQCVPKCNFDTTDLESQLSQRDYPFQTVIYSPEGSTRKSNSLDTKIQAELIADEWSKDGRFDSNYTTLIVVDHNDRQMTMHPGYKIQNRFKYEHRIESEIFKRDFRPHMQSTPPDWTSAVGSYSVSLDEYFRDIAGYTYNDRVEADHTQFMIGALLVCVFFAAVGYVVVQARNGRLGYGGFGRSGSETYYYHDSGSNSSGGSSGSSTHDY